MVLSGIGKRYAVALYGAASKQDIDDQVSDDINAFARLMEENARFRSFLMSPLVRAEEKKSFVKAVIGDRASGLFVSFVILLIEKKRLGNIDEIATAYTHIWEDAHDIVEVRCITAIPLDHDLQTRTRQIIEGKLRKKCRLTADTDKSIIGGMIVLAGDRIIDGSIRYQLEQIGKSLANLKVN